MGWKFYSLGDQKSAQNIANAAIPYLEGMGYSVVYSNTGTTSGDLAITIDGVAYSCILYLANSTAYPTYLMVNDETNEILIGQTGRSVSASSQLNYIVCMALLRGTTVKTGEVGLFPVGCSGSQAAYFTNWWGRFEHQDELLCLQRAVFIKHTASTGTVQVAESIFSDLYWGNRLYTPGATCAVGSDTFMCLNGCMFAKL